MESCAVTEEAEYALRWYGACPACRSAGPEDDGEWAAWVFDHATECMALRAQVEPRVLMQAHARRREG